MSLIQGSIAPSIFSTGIIGLVKRSLACNSLAGLLGIE